MGNSPPDADYLDHAPVKEIAARIIAWPAERRSDLLLLVRRARYRKLGSDANGHAVRHHPWKYRTTPEQRARLISLHAGGMTIRKAAQETGIVYTTAVSIIGKGH